MGYTGAAGKRSSDRPARVSVRVSPGAARTEIVGRHGDGWKARVAAPAERGRANQALLELVATTLGVERRRVRLVSGQTSRDKVIEVDGMTHDQAERLLAARQRRETT
ncbi:MAG: DUF167 domain-containing protein [Thermoleophilia bacterium]|nr:DUF167 domain-containing protein [Thermoleophilia bacterium]